MEQKLTDALQGKMESLEEKLGILQQNREAEERMIHSMATMRIIPVRNTKKLKQ